MKRVPLQDRFDAFAFPEPMSGCWLWDGCWNEHGYGTINVERKPTLAHRVSYTLHIGPIPEEMNVLHRCDLPCCVNPDHLFIGTQGDNVHDMERKNRSYHPFGENHGRAKLTETEVLSIRSDYRSAYALSKIYPVSSFVILQIRKRRIWKHI